MPHLPVALAVAFSPLLLGLTAAEDQPKKTAEDQESDPPKLAMTSAIVCESVAGFRDYVERAEPVLTRDDKLILYFEPSGYATEKVGKAYRVYLTEDVRLRKHGEKKVFWQKDDILKYEVKAKTPPLALYSANTIALKACDPGEYDLELILHDRIGKGPPSTQIVRFRVRPSPPAPEKKADEKTPPKPR